MEDQRADYTMAVIVIKKKTLVSTHNYIMKLNPQPTCKAILLCCSLFYGNLLLTVASEEISVLHQTY